MKKATRMQILQAYDQSAGLYTDLAATSAQLLAMVLRQEGLILHTITQRRKERHSLESKLNRPGKNYRQIQDITDIAAVRLTTYFSDDVDRVATIVERELAIDHDASIDKRAHADPDRFGYQSLHYIAKFSDERCRLPEYQRFKDVRFEIQIRSILQHAWAEIEHDLGYKSSQGIPFAIRRKFARVASLLELADSEFSAIRNDLSTYEKALPARIEFEPANAELDLPTLKLLIESDSDIQALDSMVCEVSDGYIEEAASVTIIEGLLRKLKFFGVRNANELQKISIAEKDNVRAFANHWLTGSELGGVSKGIGLFYLAYVLAHKTGSIVRIREYLDFESIDEEQNRDATANDIFRFQRIKT